MRVASRPTLPLLALSWIFAAGCAAAQPSAARTPDGGPPLQVAAPPTIAVDGGASARTSTLPAFSARIKVGDRTELPIERMDMQVRVDGFRARVLVDLEFQNPGAEVLEGTFQLRLPDDASPYFLAFGQNTRTLVSPAPRDGGAGDPFAPAQILAARAAEGIALKEARMVARSAAAAAYTETVRPRLVRVVVDPALAEWAGAGVFNTRLFPISPATRHHVTLGFDVDLTPVGADLELRLPIPRQIPALGVDLDVEAPAPGDVVVDPRLPATRAGDRLRYHVDDPRFEQLAVRLVDRGPRLLHGQDPETGAYFAARLIPALPAGPPASPRPRAVFLVDTSLSSSGARFDLWRELLRELLTRNRDGLREFAVVFFNVEARWWQPRFVANTPGNVEAALAFADTVALEGATDLGAALAQAQAPPWTPAGDAGWDIFLLSDGASTWGEGDALALARRLRARAAACAAGPCPGALYAYRSHGVGVDPRLLGVLTRETGGSLFSVASAAEVATAATAHRTRPWQLVGVELSGAEDMLVAGRPQTVIPGQSIVLAGRGAPGKGARATLVLRQGEQERRVTTALGAPIASELTPRIYGQIAVEQLEEAIDVTRGDAEIYARHFRVAGAAASLLMLESEDDYARFGLASPPPSGPHVLQRTVQGVLAEKVGSADAGAQARLVRALEALAAAAGVYLDGRAVQLLLAAPPEALEVPPAPLSTASSAWQEIPAALRPALARHEPDPVALLVDAEQRRGRLGAGDGLKSLSSLVELSPGDDAVLREVALTALAWGEPASAHHLLRRSAALPPHDPEAHHLLAVALAELGRVELAIVHFELAFAGGWGPRFEAGRRAVAFDYLRLLARPERAARPDVAAFMRSRASELESWGPGRGAPLVVQLQWSSEDTDLDLHVLEPDGADCSYARRQTPGGGELGVDASEGLGPELYTLRQRTPGTYGIGVKYFSGDRHRLGARTRALVTVYHDPGTPQERVSRHAITLEPGKAIVPVAAVEVK